MRLFAWSSWTFDRFQTLRDNSQQHASTCNRVWKQTQNATSNNVDSCWTGGLPHLSGLPHLPGVPHHHVKHALKYYFHSFCAQYWYPCSIRTPEHYRQLCESLKGVFWMFKPVILCFSSPLPSQRPRLNGHNFFGQQLLTLLDDTSCICL